MTVDLTGVFHIIASIVTAVVGILLPIYMPKALAAFQMRTGIQLTDQQRATIQGAVATAAGSLETKLDQGLIRVADVHVANPTVAAEAQAAINAVPAAMAALGMTPDSVARMIVGKTDTAVMTRGLPVAAPVPPPAPPAMQPVVQPAQVPVAPAPAP